LNNYLVCVGRKQK